MRYTTLSLTAILTHAIDRYDRHAPTKGYLSVELLLVTALVLFNQFKKFGQHN